MGFSGQPNAQKVTDEIARDCSLSWLLFHRWSSSILDRQSCDSSVSDGVQQISERLVCGCKLRYAWDAVSCHSGAQLIPRSKWLCCDSPTRYRPRTTCSESLRWFIHLCLFTDKTPRLGLKPYRAGIAREAGGILHPAGKLLCRPARHGDLASLD